MTRADGWTPPPRRSRATRSEPFPKVVRRSIAEDVQDALTAAIQSGSLRPGEFLPTETVLSGEFGVSKASVREATRALLALGVLERQGNRLAVREFTPDVVVDGDRATLVRDLFQLRRMLEVPIASMAALKMSDDQFDALNAMAAGYRSTRDPDEFRALDRAFHWAIAAACDNPVLSEVYGKVLDQLFDEYESLIPLDGDDDRETVDWVVAESSEEHVGVLVAIQAHDPDAAAEAANRHLDQIEAGISRYLHG